MQNPFVSLAKVLHQNNEYRWDDNSAYQTKYKNNSVPIHNLHLQVIKNALNLPQKSDTVQRVLHDEPAGVVLQTHYFCAKRAEKWAL